MQSPRLRLYWAGGSLCSGSSSRPIDLTERRPGKLLKITSGKRIKNQNCCVCPAEEVRGGVGGWKAVR